MSNIRAQRAQFEIMADKIETILHDQGIEGRIDGGTASPRIIKFTWEGTAVKVEKVRPLANRIAQTLDASEARIYRDGPQLCIEIPLEKPSLLRLTAIMEGLAEVPPLTAILGDAEDVPLLLRMGNILVVGDEGSGKTTLLRSIVAGLAYYNRDMRFVLIDPRRRGLGPLAAALPSARLFDRAFEAFCYAGQLDEPTVIVIDEVLDTGEIPAQLLQTGPPTGLYVVAATRQPQVISAPNLFSTHIIGRMKSLEGAADLQGRGDFLLFAQGERVRFKAAWTGRQELTQISNGVKQ